MLDTEIENPQDIDSSDSESITSSSTNKMSYDLDGTEHYIPIVKYQQRSQTKTFTKPLSYRNLSIK